jgi:rfaE bifunctional protein nucleotidyltransferase chain/domain
MLGEMGKRASEMSRLVAERQRWRDEGRSLVLANGCFDLLHRGHVELLETARREGEVLVVALNSDASVHRLKGPGRPLFPEAERAEVLLALEAVKRSVLFSPTCSSRARTGPKTRS